MDELDWDTIQNVTDCVIDGQKLRNAKKSVISEDQPFGHSFEASQCFVQNYQIKTYIIYTV